MLSTPGSAPALLGADRKMVVSVVVVSVIAARPTAATAERPATAASATSTRRPRRRRAGIERDHPQNLNPLATLPDLAMDRRAFRRVLKSGFLQCGDVEEDIRRAIGRRDEAETLFRVEPLDTPFEFGATLLALIGHFDHSDSCRAYLYLALQDRRTAHDPPDAEEPAGSMVASPLKSKTRRIGVDCVPCAFCCIAGCPPFVNMLKF
jgi:hypothetical protein